MRNPRRSWSVVTSRTTSSKSPWFHVGADLPFLNGSSLTDLPYLFVPRLLAPDKVHVPIGQLYTHKIDKSDQDTYISVSHISEWYWNFGWPGVAFGMTLTGLMLGFVGARSSLERGVTLTRVMILVATVQSMCLGFEGRFPAPIRFGCDPSPRFCLCT